MIFLSVHIANVTKVTKYHLILMNLRFFFIKKKKQIQSKMTEEGQRVKTGFVVQSHIYSPLAILPWPTEGFRSQA